LQRLHAAGPERTRIKDMGCRGCLIEEPRRRTALGPA
jgi:hypothetical protein